MTAWTTFVTKLFRDRSKKNPDYKFKNALKDAAKLYKKGGADGDKEEEKYAAGELEPEPEPEVASELEPEVASELEPELEPEPEPEVASELEPVPAAQVQTAGSESCRFGGKRNSRRNKKGGKKSSRKMKKGGKKSLRKSKGSRASKKNRA
jgi:hypothetical protein